MRQRPTCPNLNNGPWPCVKYLATDLVSGDILAELPLGDVSFSYVLNGSGDFKASLNISDPKVKKLNPILATEPAKTGIYVEDNGVLLWGGIIWTREYDGKLRIAANDFWSYFRSRIIREDLDFVEVDQFTIATDILDSLMAEDGSLQFVHTSPTCGVLRDRHYYAYEFKPGAEAIEQLSAVQNGFDFVTDVTYINGEITRRFIPSFPRRGRTADVTGLTFELPGNIQSYKWPEDGTKLAVRSYAMGAGEEAEMLTATSTNNALLGDYPLYEQVLSYKDVSVQQTLNDHAQADMVAASKPENIASLTVKTQLGAFTLGDEAAVVIKDDRHDINTTKRITSYEVTPSTQTVSITLGG